jgi:hypothetical protein
VTRARRSRPGPRAETRTWPIVAASLAAFVLLGSLSLILALLHVRVVPEAATSSHGVTLLTAPRHPATVSLPATARPADASGAVAALPGVSSARQTSLVAAEDARIRAVMHGAERIYQPEAVPYQGARPTLVLPDGARAWTAADLVHYGAMVMVSRDTGLLTENVFVAADAQLILGSPTLRTLDLDSTSSGFTSIVTWGGGLSFAGTAAAPLTIEGWNHTTSKAAADLGSGRPYIRAVGGLLTLSHVRASALGFWSGRTGGVAWTGVTAEPSQGGATDSTFTGDTYGAFVARGENVAFSGDLFESNELDGLHIHRYSTGSRVISSAAARNGGNGFQIDRDTRDTVLRGDLAQHNAVNGYYVDGRPLVTGASASGGSAVPSTGTVLENSEATGNARTGILVEGGSGTIVRSDEVCAAVTGIALRTGAANAVLTGNDIRCHPRTGLSVGPSAPGTVASGNALSGARIGIMIRDSGRVTVDSNLVTGATVFGLTTRGVTSHVSGVGNVLSGTGVNAVDTRAGASSPSLARTDISGWSHGTNLNFFSYLDYHPLAALWLGILVLILLAAAWSYRRRLPDHPYPASTRWRGPAAAGAAMTGAAVAGAAMAGEPSLAVDPGRARAHPVAGHRPFNHPGVHAPYGQGPPRAELTRPQPQAAARQPPPARAPQPPRAPQPAGRAPQFVGRAPRRADRAPQPAERRVPAPEPRPQPAVTRPQPVVPRPPVELTRPQRAVQPGVTRPQPVATRPRVEPTRPQRAVPPPPPTRPQPAAPPRDDDRRRGPR